MPVLHWVYGVNWSTICNSGHLDGDRTVRLIGSLSIHDCILGGRSPQFLVQLGVEQDYAIYYSCMVRNTIMLLPYYQYFTATSKYNDYIYSYTLHNTQIFGCIFLNAMCLKPLRWQDWSPQCPWWMPLWWLIWLGSLVYSGHCQDEEKVDRHVLREQVVCLKS